MTDRAHTTQGSPSYNGSGSLNTGTDNIDSVLVGVPYSPDNGVSTTYYDNAKVDSGFIGSLANNAPTAPTSLQTESQTNPTNITDSYPEFSAIYNDPDAGDLALSYRIQVSTTSLGNWSHPSPFWDSGTTTMATTTQGNRSPQLSYTGSALGLYVG